MIRLFLVMILFSSCSQMTTKPLLRSELNKSFKLRDTSGDYLVKRDFKYTKKKAITRIRILSQTTSQAVLEKTIIVSYVNKNQNGDIGIVPSESLFSVWYNKKNFQTKMKINSTKKKLIVNIIDPEKEEEKEEVFDLPKTRYACFYSQLAECLLGQNILLKARDKSVPITIIWSNYPLHNQQYIGLNNSIYTKASVRFVEKRTGNLRFEVDLGNQVLSIDYDRQFQFQNLYWINQGITLERNH